MNSSAPETMVNTQTHQPGAAPLGQPPRTRQGWTQTSGSACCASGTCSTSAAQRKGRLSTTVRDCEGAMERGPTNGCRQDDEEDQEDPHDQAEADHVTVVVLLGASRNKASASLLSLCLHSFSSLLSGRGPGGDTGRSPAGANTLPASGTAQRSCNNRITL